MKKYTPFKISQKPKRRSIFFVSTLIFSVLVFLLLVFLVLVYIHVSRIIMVRDERILPTHNNNNNKEEAIPTHSGTTFFRGTKHTPRQDLIYHPSHMELFLIQQAETLGLTQPNASVCNLWKNHTDYKDIQDDLSTYLHQLEEYNALLEKFQRSTLSSETSILQEIGNAVKEEEEEEEKEEGGKRITWQQAQQKVCRTLRIHPQGLQGIFPNPQRILSQSTSNGYVEPLLPPMRHPLFCSSLGWGMLGSLQYLIHDFEQMCLNLKPTSKLILIDMGAALDRQVGTNGPVFDLLHLYRKFGFFFDHVYAYELQPKDTQTQVYNRLPKYILPAYHWINAPVSTNKTSHLNPLQMILDTLEEDDLILVKLDIDTPQLEMKFMDLLLETETTNTGTSYGKLLDHFYFEHHVCIAEMLSLWQECNGTAYDSLALFHSLRKRGIASHFWT